jgi:hypothetical protein
MMRNVSKVIVLVVLGACGSSGAGTPAAKSTAVPKSEVGASSEAPDAKAVCVQMFVRQRECTDTFIPALVDARVRHDVPPGIAAKDQSGGREALVALAMEEWKADSTDEAIDATCTKMTGPGGPDLSGAIETAKGCLAESACEAFTPCAIGIVEGHLDR